MRIPKLPTTRPLIAAADTAAVLVLTTGTGRTHASEPANRQDTKNTGGTAVSFELSGPSSPSLANNAKPRQTDPDHGRRQRGEQEVAMG